MVVTNQRRHYSNNMETNQRESAVRYMYLKVITKRPRPKHLKERVMKYVTPNVIKIVVLSCNKAILDLYMCNILNKIHK